MKNYRISEPTYWFGLVLIGILTWPGFFGIFYKKQVIRVSTNEIVALYITCAAQVHSGTGDRSDSISKGERLYFCDATRLKTQYFSEGTRHCICGTSSNLYGRFMYSTIQMRALQPRMENIFFIINKYHRVKYTVKHRFWGASQLSRIRIIEKISQSVK